MRVIESDKVAEPASAGRLAGWLAGWLAGNDKLRWLRLVGFLLLIALSMEATCVFRSVRTYVYKRARKCILCVCVFTVALVRRQKHQPPLP